MAQIERRCWEALATLARRRISGRAEVMFACGAQIPRMIQGQSSEPIPLLICISARWMTASAAAARADGRQTGLVVSPAGVIVRGPRLDGVYGALWPTALAGGIKPDKPLSAWLVKGQGTKEKHGGG